MMSLYIDLIPATTTVGLCYAWLRQGNDFLFTKILQIFFSTSKCLEQLNLPNKADKREEYT